MLDSQLDLSRPEDALGTDIVGRQEEDGGRAKLLENGGGQAEAVPVSVVKRDQ